MQDAEAELEDSGAVVGEDLASEGLAGGIAVERVEQLAAMREQMTQLLESERGQRKRMAAQLSKPGVESRGGRWDQAVSSGVSAVVRVAAGPPRVAGLKGRVDSPAKKRIGGPKGFGSSSPARVRKPKGQGAAAAATADAARRAASPAAVPRVATLAAAEQLKPRPHSRAARRGFGASGSRDTNPAAWESSLKGEVPHGQGRERDEEVSTKAIPTGA